MNPAYYMDKHGKENRAENQEEAKNIAQLAGGGIGGFIGATKAAGAVRIDPFEEATTSKFKGPAHLIVLYCRVVWFKNVYRYI